MENETLYKKIEGKSAGFYKIADKVSLITGFGGLGMVILSLITASPCLERIGLVSYGVSVGYIIGSIKANKFKPVSELEKKIGG